MNIVKWFRNRQRIKRRLHWARCGWLLLACVLLVGCDPGKAPKQRALFREGQFINLRLNGVRGQVIDVSYLYGDYHYQVRVDTDNVVYLNQYEMTLSRRP